MIVLRSLFRRISDFWTVPLRPEPLALFRILLGSVGLLSLLISLAPSLELYLGPKGLCPAEASDGWLRRSGRFTLLAGPVNLPIPHDWLPADWVASATEQGRGVIDAWTRWTGDFTVVRGLFVVWLVALACMTIGLATRPATILAWLLTVTFHVRLTWVLNGGDALFRTGLFYLMLAPSGSAWSVDRWLWPTTSPPRIPAWPVRLMQIQLTLLYLATGVAKLPADWIPGQAVYWVLNDLALTRWAYATLPIPMLFCQVIAWCTLLFELGFPILVLFRRVRPWLLAFGIAFHLGIWITTEVGWFSPITLCWYALFLKPESARRVLDCLTGGLGQGPVIRSAPGSADGPFPGHLMV